METELELLIARGDLRPAAILQCPCIRIIESCPDHWFLLPPSVVFGHSLTAKQPASPRAFGNLLEVKTNALSDSPVLVIIFGILEFAVDGIRNFVVK